MNRFVDHLISSINALYIALISFFIIYIFVCFNHFQHNAAVGNLVALDRLLALRSIALEVNSSDEKSKLSQLPNFFERANSEAFKASDDSEIDPYSQESMNKRGFTDSQIDQTYIRKSLPMRMAVGAECDVLVTKAKKGSTFGIATFLIIGKVSRVKSEDTYLISFAQRCAPGFPSEFEALIFRLDDGHFAIGLPKSFESTFPGLAPPMSFTSFEFQNIDALKSQLPEPIQKYANLDEPFVIQNLRAIEYLILSYSSSRTEAFYRIRDFDNAVQKLYEEQERKTPFFGVNADTLSVINLGPFLFFFLSFELWRRVRRLPSGRITAQKYWFAFETSDFIGKSYAYLCAVAPLVMGLTVYASFAVSQGQSLIIFNRVFSLRSLVTLSAPIALPSGWRVNNDFADFLLYFLIIQIIILALITAKLISVVKRNVEPKKRIKNH